MTERISGIIAPVTTPFADEELSIDHLRSNIRQYGETPLAGFFALGSNGENKSLTEEEKLKIIETVVEEKSEGQIVMAGTGYESTRQTIAFSKKAAELGADCVSLLTPSYFKKRLTDEAMIRYYTEVAEALDVPVLAYNAPGFTGMTLSARVIEKISQHPNVAGMKDTSPDGLARYLAVRGENFDVLSGTINTLFIGLSLGASGGVVSLANAFPLPCCELYNRFQEGDLEGARELHYRLFNLNQTVSGSFGVAGVKYAMEVAGYYGGLPRRPLLPLTDGDKESIRRAISKAGLAEPGQP
ncbi:MAG: dihydrodipicolinate synthase family protein [Deltaproteobacteria bacterium]|nr:dihydrodipicolinate synthase family protein [Deltaproteobacteria bacterium]